MKYVGLLIAIASIAAFSFGYTKFLKRRNKVYSELAKLTALIGERLSAFRAPLSELCRDCGCDELTSIGFFSKAIEEGKAREGAALLPIDKEDSERLCLFLESFGRAYVENELERTGALAKYFSERAERENSEYKDKTKLCAVLSASLLLGLMLLCI